MGSFLSFRGILFSIGKSIHTSLHLLDMSTRIYITRSIGNQHCQWLVNFEGRIGSYHKQGILFLDRILFVSDYRGTIELIFAL